MVVTLKRPSSSETAIKGGRSSQIEARSAVKLRVAFAGSKSNVQRRGLRGLITIERFRTPKAFRTAGKRFDQSSWQLFFRLIASFLRKFRRENSLKHVKLNSKVR